MKESVRAIILAAGRSSRMTGFKPLLPLGGVSAIERQIELFQAAGVDEIFVVCGHRADELIPVVRDAGAMPVVNKDYERGMYSSVRAGVAAVGRKTRAFFVLPLDVMLVRRDSIVRLVSAHGRTPDRILHPVFERARGHPPLIPGRLGDEILEWGGERGLAGFLELHEDISREVPVADEHVLFDVDTDDDYRKALESLESYDVPSRAECMALLAITPNVNDRGREHSLAVADFALQIAKALNAVREEAGRLDLGLVEAGALLHDIAKGLPAHEREGGEMLSEMGYPRVGEVVAAHRDIDLPDGRRVTERVVVFLADKLAQGDRLVSVKDRYQAKMDHYAHDPEAVTAIRGRLDRALKIKFGMEKELGVSIEDMVKTPR